MSWLGGLLARLDAAAIAACGGAASARAGCAGYCGRLSVTTSGEASEPGEDSPDCVVALRARRDGVGSTHGPQ